jgi:hypothetical protein
MGFPQMTYFKFQVPNPKSQCQIMSRMGHSAKRIVKKVLTLCSMISALCCDVYV